MSWLERFARRRGISALLVLFLASLGVDATAAMPIARQAQAVMVADAAPMAAPAPGLTDCMPCAYCHAAPVPSVQGFSGESAEPEGPAWPPLAGTLTAVPKPLNAGWERQSRVPLRIAYCRWSN